MLQNHLNGLSKYRFPGSISKILIQYSWTTREFTFNHVADIDSLGTLLSIASKKTSDDHSTGKIY